jgi:hypothetical protein
MKNDGMFVVLMILLGVCTCGFGLFILMLMWMFDSNTPSQKSFWKDADDDEDEEYDKNEEIGLVLKQAIKTKDPAKKVLTVEKTIEVYEKMKWAPCTTFSGIGSEHKCSDGIYIYTGGNPALMLFKDVPGAVWRGTIQ